MHRLKPMHGLIKYTFMAAYQISDYTDLVLCGMTFQTLRDSMQI